MHTKIIIILAGLMLLCQAQLRAQHSTEEAYNKLIRLTSIFNGADPYACHAVVQVNYKGAPGDAAADTATLIYRNRSTYYKSKLVERVAASQGELIINHELKQVNFYISDSIKQVLQREMKSETDKDLETLLDSNIERNDLEAFHSFLIKDCDMSWNAKGDLEEISFSARNAKQATLVLVKIRFDRTDRVQYYEYTSRDVYAQDWNGNARFRMVRTLYDHFNYDSVPNIPSRLNDFLDWDGWNVKLRKYTNYKLSVL